MSAREPEPCDVPRGVHEGPVRFYITGWKCAAHAPKPQPATDRRKDACDRRPCS
jgi:hypothetical protein